MKDANVLVVANHTAGSPELLRALRSRASTTPARFMLLVPATPKGLSWATDMRAGVPEARIRAATGARALRIAGVPIEDTAIGDPDPVAAATDELRRRSYDELVVATLPRNLSRWLRISLPQRLQRLTDLPLTHVVARSEAPVPVRLPDRYAPPVRDFIAGSLARA